MSAVSEILNRKPKRIVTGQRPDGTSYFARIEEVDYDWRSAASPDRTVDVHRMWANDRLPVDLPFTTAAAPLESNPSPEDTPDALRNSSPQPGTPNGLRLSLIKFHPNQAGRGDLAAGLHWHDTFDVQWLMAGDVTIGMDDGSEVDLKPGDAIIQHGTNHTWRIGPEGAVVALFMLGAKRTGVTPPPDRKRDMTPQALAARASQPAAR
jgi:hypothetical protein